MLAWTGVVLAQVVVGMIAGPVTFGVHTSTTP
jgi:hypothetical protein